MHRETTFFQWCAFEGEARYCTVVCASEQMWLDLYVASHLLSMNRSAVLLILLCIKLAWKGTCCVALFLDYPKIKVTSQITCPGNFTKNRICNLLDTREVQPHKLDFNLEGDLLLSKKHDKPPSVVHCALAGWHGPSYLWSLCTHLGQHIL